MKIDEGEERQWSGDDERKSPFVASILETSEGISRKFSIQDRQLVKKSPMGKGQSRLTNESFDNAPRPKGRVIKSTEAIVRQDKDRPHVYHVISKKSQDK